MDNKSNHKENKERSPRERNISYLRTIPASDVNFTYALKDADAEMIRAALENIPEENNKSRIRILTAKLNSLEKSRPKALREDLEQRKIALEEKGWTLDLANRIAVKRFEAEKVNAKLENAVSVEHLLIQAEALELSYSKIPDDSDGDGKTVSNAEVVRSIPIAQIIPSPFEPQARRRAKFAKNEISALSESIKQFGLRQPILVRPRFDEFEIVFGERRFLSVQNAGLDLINCFVENLSDAEVIELQYEENHNRQEPDPLDDAFTFAYLKNEKSYSIHDLAIKFSTSEASVLRKLKLNDLIDEAKQQLSDGFLPLGHAVYMAAFSADVQKKIIDDEMAFSYEGAETGNALTLAEFKQDVEVAFVRKLADAPFDIRDERLHAKGLICPNCTQRTGAEPKLYDDDLEKNDTCLNRQCFEMKTNVNLRIKQAEIAEQNAATMGEAVDISNRNASTLAPDPDRLYESELKKVPLVTTRSAVNKKELPIKGEILTNQEILDEPECEFSILSLDIDKGRKVYVCKNAKCPTHHPEKIVPDEQKGGPTDYEMQQMEKRFQIEVGMTVRERVLAKSIEHFNGSNSFWQYADLVEKLIVEFVLERAYYLRQHPEIIKVFKNIPKDLSDKKSVERFVGELDSRRKDQLLFLTVFCAEGFMRDYGQYRSQAEIKKLAKSYAKTNYKLIDAGVRFDLAPDEFKVTAELYENDVVEGNKTEIPRFWWEGFEFPED